MGTEETSASSVEPYAVRKATPGDLDSIKVIADTHRHELGFVLRPALARSIQRGQVFVAQNSTGLVGFVEYHHRQDERTTIYHIAVDPAYRRQGIGTKLVEALRIEAAERGQTSIRLKCPADLPANDFYKGVGFVLRGEESGKRRSLLVWELEIEPQERSAL